MRIPSDNKWNVAQEGDIFGVINTCHNVSLGTPGYVSLEGRPVSLYTSADDGDFAYLMNGLFYDGVYQLITSDGIFELNPQTLAITENTSSGVPTPSLSGDSVVFNGYMYVTTTSNMKKWDGAGTWSSNLLSTTSSRPHPLCVVENLNYLAVGDANVVKLLNTSDSTVATLTLPTSFWVTSIRYFNNFLYIGTKHIYGGDAYVFVWNGSGSSAQSAYNIKSNWVFSLETFDSSICCVTNAGQLLRFNGGGFDSLANFPVFYTNKIWQDDTTGFSLNGKVFNRGMKADGDTLHIVIDGSIANIEANANPSSNIYNQPSGLWNYTIGEGLYCRSITSADKYQSVGVSSLSSDVLTLASSTNLTTGEPVYFSSVGSITGITVLYTYYAIVLTSTTIKLALTRWDATQGNALTLGGTAGAANIYCANYRNIGEKYGALQGAVFTAVPAADPMRTIFNGNVIWGGSAYRYDASETDQTLCTISNCYNEGEFTINKVLSSGVTDTYQKIFVRFEGIHNDNDKIIVKYRTEEREDIPTSIPMNAAWIDATTFTNTDALTSFSAIQAGDEVTILNGYHSGQTAKVLSNELVGSNYILTIDRSFGTAGNSFQVMADNYLQVGEVNVDSATAEEGYAEFEIPTKNKRPWIQIKIEIRGCKVKIIDLDLVSTVNKKTV